MDEIEKRLREDAERIEAPVTPELQARVRASLEKVPLEKRPRRRAREVPPLGLWMAASLTGAAAALVAFLLLPRTGAPPPAPAAVARSMPLPASIAREFPLVVKTADLTAPLEQELEHLQSDIEKARERVQQDLDF